MKVEVQSSFQNLSHFFERLNFKITKVIRAIIKKNITKFP